MARGDGGVALSADFGNYSEPSSDISRDIGDEALPQHATNEVILAAVREWVALLVEERYVEAHTFLTYAPERVDHWTPELMATVIRNYGSLEPFPDGRTFQVTSLDEATGPPSPRHDVDWFDDVELGDSYRGHIWFDLPLNGKWSDLTATFYIADDGDNMVLELDDIHVM